MKTQRFILLVAALFVALISNGQHYKADGTPDMRYRENKALYGSTYSSPSTSFSLPSTTPSYRYQSGYTRSDGTYVSPHYKTRSNNTNWDNYSTIGNTNPFTGKSGSIARDYSPGAYNYGQGRTIHQGPRGGQYYYNSNGNKTYVPKRNYFY